MGHDPVEVLAARLQDARSRRVVFVSHCLLNENTRYLGGAFHPGAVPPLVDELVRSGMGLVQLPCPEQRAWGGVLKRRLLRAYGSSGTLAFRLRGPLLRFFLWRTRVAYRRLARRAAADVQDYVDAGFRVVGVIGVGGSPSCGVRSTMSMHRALGVVASSHAAETSRDELNEELLVRCRTSGPGLFVLALRRELGRRGLDVPLLEHDLLAELRGEPQDVLSGLSEPSG